MKKIIILVLSFFFFSACQKNSPPVSSPTSTSTPTNIVAATPSATPSSNPMCDWIDKSDVILQVIVPSDMTADTSYEAGFVYSKPDKPSLELKLARVARAQCDYRVGFNQSDFTALAHAQIAVWSYTGTIRQKLATPVSINFVDGLPDFGKSIKINLVR